MKLECLYLPKTIVRKLEQINITTVEELWCCNRLFLKQSGFTDVEISQIRIKLQLEGMDLNHKYYKV